MKSKCSYSSIYKSLIRDCSMKGFLIELMEVIHVESSLYRILKISNKSLSERYVSYYRSYLEPLDPLVAIICAQLNKRGSRARAHRGSRAAGSPSQREERGSQCLPEHRAAPWAPALPWGIPASALQVGTLCPGMGFLTPGPCLGCQSKPGNWEMPPSFCLLSLNC